MLQSIFKCTPFYSKLFQLVGAEVTMSPTHAAQAGPRRTGRCPTPQSTTPSSGWGRRDRHSVDNGAGCSVRSPRHTSASAAQWAAVRARRGTQQPPCGDGNAFRRRARAARPGTQCATARGWACSEMTATCVSRFMRAAHMPLEEAHPTDPTASVENCLVHCTASRVRNALTTPPHTEEPKP